MLQRHFSADNQPPSYFPSLIIKAVSLLCGVNISYWQYSVKPTVTDSVSFYRGVGNGQFALLALAIPQSKVIRIYLSCDQRLTMCTVVVANQPWGLFYS